MSARRSGALLVLMVSGLLGFRVGFVEFPTWQVAVESSQVVAGLVKYPPQNPFYVYHVKLWTVLHQGLALALHLGLSEIALSKFVSGLLGAVSFQALSMFVYVFAADVLLAIGTPFLVFYTRAAEHGAVYPIALLGTDHTYGVIGLSLAVLVVGLIGARCYRLGGFLLGAAPAVHASWGAWLLLIVGVAAVTDFRRLRTELRPGAGYLVAGCLFTGASLLLQRLVIDHVPPIDPQEYTRYLSGFVNAWDGHRQAAPLVSVGLIVNVDLLICTLVWLVAFGQQLTIAGRFVLRVVMAAAALSLVLLFMTWVPPERVPTAVLIAMPARFLNFNTLLFVPLMLGLLGVHRRMFASQAIIASLVIGLFFSYRSMLWDAYRGGSAIVEAIQFNPWHVFVTISLATLAVAALAARRQRVSADTLPTDAWQTSDRMSLPSRLLRGISLVTVAASAVLVWRLSYPEIFRDRTNDGFYAAVAAEHRGLLLTEGSFHLMQLYTRRPVLLDGGGLDSLPYSVEGAPEMERILRGIYGIDYFNPPPETERGAAIPHGLVRPRWEGFSRLKWMEIGHDFNVTQILTPSGWTLDLPLTAEDPDLRLYQIPDRLP